MKYMFLLYGSELPAPGTDEARTLLEQWSTARQAMADAGVLKSSAGLQPTATATTVRTADGRHQVLDGPYADSKEQLGGFHIIEVADLDAAISWASRSPTSIHGVVEVRPLFDGTFLTRGIEDFIKPE